jgi:hypothetical protein
MNREQKNLLATENEYAGGLSPKALSGKCLGLFLFSKIFMNHP